MPEEIPATPGWADRRADEAFATLPKTPAVKSAIDAYMACLATRKSPSTPSDTLGSEFNGCRTSLRRTLESEAVESLDALDAKLEALEAEIAAGS
jgi:hypothetical protein